MMNVSTTAEGTQWEVLDAIEYRARTAPEAPFLTFQGDHRSNTITNTEFAALVRSTAARLAGVGLGPGDACILHTGNTQDFVVLLCAVIHTGAVVVPTISMSTAEELKYVVEHSEARLLLTTEELHPVAEQAITDAQCRLYLTSHIVSPTTDVAVELGSARSSCPSDTAILMYTSGTSGRPKGVLLSRQAVDFTVMTYAQHLRLRNDDTVLVCMPLFHVNGMMLQLLPSIVSGAHTILTPKFSASNYWRWVSTYDVTVGHLVSGPIRLLLQQPSEPLARPMRVMTFGLPLTSEEISDFQHRYGPQLLMVWGLTETCCGATLMGLEHKQRPHLQNLGQALRGWEVKVVDESGNALPAGESGELLVSSPGIMTGYHRDTEATQATVRNGYIATGDLGYIDEDGYVHFVSRIKDMLKPNGENVAAQEISDVLTLHPSIEEAAVFGVDDPITTEKVIAAVIPVDGATITAAEVRAHCSEHLARFKVPSEVLMLSSIPKTSIGKQQVSKLKTQYLQNH